MARMGDGYGSECHLLRFLGRHRVYLDRRVAAKVGADSVSWLDFHFNCAKPWQDEERLGLDFLDKGSAVVRRWKTFWPRTGNPPNWDAVARIRVKNREEWLLVEAKANLKELKSSCGAKGEGRDIIESALRKTKQALGVSHERRWMQDYYQYCNRLAALWFLNQNSVPSRLLFIYFVGDRSGKGRDCPKNESQWATTLNQQKEHVGLPPGHALEDRIHDLFLKVCPEESDIG